jgi:hypothetical protein
MLKLGESRYQQDRNEHECRDDRGGAVTNAELPDPPRFPARREIRNPVAASVNLMRTSSGPPHDGRSARVLVNKRSATETTS